jgi:hypothetical protein
MKQTAVEWLVEEIHKNINWIPPHIVEQANEMFEQQIIDAFEQGDYTGRGFEDLTSEEYYHINFKSE